MKDFSIQESLSVGWDVFKSRFGFFILLLLIAGLLLFIPQFVMQLLAGNAGDEGVSLVVIIVSILLQLFQYFLTIGLFKISLLLLDGKNPQIGDLFSGGDVFLAYVLGSILYGLIVIGGIILLIIPGIIFAVMYEYYGLFIIDKKMGVMDALKASAALTKGVRWKLFGFGLVVGLINLLGALLLMLGLFVTIPVTMVALAHVYRQLLPQMHLTLTR